MRHLTLEILRWWQNAQFWEAYPGKSQFDEDPELVRIARQYAADEGIGLEEEGIQI